MKKEIQKRNDIIVATEKLVRELAAKLSAKTSDAKLVNMFKKCFMNTVETTVECINDNEIFLVTGDIEAMWLRDSSAQVVHYLPFADKNAKLSEMIKGLIARQFFYVNLDPYANAYNVCANGNRWADDDTDMNDYEWERKYEIDSLCYPVKLIDDFYHKTGDASVFTDDVHRGLVKIVEVWKREQRHFEESDYRFTRVDCPYQDTLHNEGKGEPVGYTGMTWSGFRPSDDACTYGYLIPSNLFAAAVLERIDRIAREHYDDAKLAKDACKLRKEILEGVQKFGVIDNEEYGKIYAYETDGLGKKIFMDDANVPSLISLPWLNACDSNDEIYLNTRRAALSHLNPYYYEGSCAKGIGSPHTPEGYIWDIALCMQGLTSTDETEREYLLKMIVANDAGTGFMHEGFNCNKPSEYTRDWFAWANSLFALYVIDFYKLA